ncbi:MAG: response regulator transcription factor [Pyrinomonadaceae bacterium]
MVKNLLIVDDNASMRRLIRSVVEDLAESIHERKDGSEALAAYEKHLPEWILMDVEMKEKDGITATREIIDLHPEANILILTRYDSVLIRERAMKAGASIFMLKENLLAIREINLPSRAKGSIGPSK